MNRRLQNESDARCVTGSQIRCAIYTRKSTDEGLDQNFNSLDAQREAAEAFIHSQRGEGFVPLPERYDDGGFSGSNLDRPALERLLADIRSGAIECVVVYKVDRLSRSLLDFARIIEIFESHHVSFVSVTQQFNTTNSLGRLTLNVLLSFAQFEREIIAERTRDKVSAARRRGKWTGGRPVLGYDIDPVAGRLVLNADEAVQVRMIFKLYVEYMRLSSVAREINRRGWRTKEWVTKNGAAHGGKLFTKVRLFRLLRNPIYIGKVAFKDQIYEGEHDEIVEPSIWETVQEIRHQSAKGGAVDDRGYRTLLDRLLCCACCDIPMLPSRSAIGSRRDRYYICAHTPSQGRRKCRSGRVSENAVSASVKEQIRGVAANARVLALIVAKAKEQRQIGVANLKAELEVTRRSLARLCADTTGSKDRIAQVTCRLAEVEQELRFLEDQNSSCDEVGIELARFERVWQSLTSREQRRIVDTLIERVIHNGNTSEIKVISRWRVV